MKIDYSLIDRLRSIPNENAQEIAINLEKYNQISCIDPEMALVRSRRVVECVLNAVAMKEGVTVGTKRLDQLLGDLKRNGNLPRIIEKYCRILQDFGNLGAHEVEVIESSESLGMPPTDLRVVVIPLEAVIHWYLKEVIPRLPEERRLTVLSGTQITRAHIDCGLQIDKEVYPEMYWGTREICYAWLDRNPDIYTLLLDLETSKIVGVINAMPIDDETFLQIKRGKMNDLEICPENIRTFDLPDFYKMYFASIALLPAYEGTNAFRLLYNAFLEKLLRLAQRDMVISELVADAITAKGVKLCEYVGMVKVTESDHGSSIYAASLLPPTLRATTISGKKLQNYYRTKFEEFRDLLEDQ